MSDIKLVRPHSLPIAKARALVQKAADSLAADYDLSSEWQGDTLRFERQGVDGQMQVTASEIRLDITLGFLLKAFRGKLLERIEHKFDELMPASGNAAAKSARPAKAAKKSRTR